MVFEVEYFHERVLAEVESWPVDLLADYARLIELLVELGRVFDFHTHGPLAMAFSNCDLVPGQALAARSIALWRASGLLCCTRLLRSLSKHQNVNSSWRVSAVKEVQDD